MTARGLAGLVAPGPSVCLFRCAGALDCTYTAPVTQAPSVDGSG